MLSPSPFLSFSFPAAQAAHWLSSHKAVCLSPPPDAEEEKPPLQITPLPRVSAADFVRWSAAYAAARRLIDSGRFTEARSSIQRLLPAIESALGPEAEELVTPLQLICSANRRLGQLADSYTIMLRALTICEKHHGEEGMRTCMLRSDVGEPTGPSVLTSFFLAGILLSPFLYLRSPFAGHF